MANQTGSTEPLVYCESISMPVTNSKYIFHRSFTQSAIKENRGIVIACLISSLQENVVNN